jgi:ribosomal protein S18 acetylase RimI-like enzyme
MTVRDYTTADFAAVCRIYLDAKPAELKFEAGKFTVTPLEDDAVIQAAFNESVVSVYDDGEVQGFAAVFDGQLRAMFVQGSARGKGVGQALLNAVLTEGMSLNVARSNMDAIRFYEKNGFVIVGSTTRQYSGIGVLYAQMRRPGVVVRYLREDDWQELKRIRLAALLDAPTAFGVSHASAAAYTDAAWCDRAAGLGPARYFLAFDGGEAVGIVAHVPDANQELNLIAMWVAPSQRGTPTAARLVSAVKAHATTQGYKRLLLDVSPTNLPAVRFYQKQGFVFLPEWEPLESHPDIQLQKMAWMTDLSPTG